MHTIGKGVGEAEGDAVGKLAQVLHRCVDSTLSLAHTTPSIRHRLEGSISRLLASLIVVEKGEMTAYLTHQTSDSHMTCHDTSPSNLAQGWSRSLGSLPTAGTSTSRSEHVLRVRLEDLSTDRCAQIAELTRLSSRKRLARGGKTSRCCRFSLHRSDA